jgi:hypothetical protein
MATMQTVNLAVVLMFDSEGRLVLNYNERWGAYSLPASKLGELPIPTGSGTASPEPPVSAATRAAVEVLGRPLTPDQRPVPVAAEVPPYNLSGSNGKWKRYRYHVFAMRTPFTPQPLPGHVALPVRLQDIANLAPISPTVALVLDAVSLPEVRAALGL